MSCRICRTPVKFFARMNGFDVMQCPACGFGQVDVPPQVLATFYDRENFSGEKASFAQRENEEASAARREMFPRRPQNESVVRPTLVAPTSAIARRPGFAACVSISTSTRSLRAKSPAMFRTLHAFTGHKAPGTCRARVTEPSAGAWMR